MTIVTVADLNQANKIIPQAPRPSSPIGYPVFAYLGIGLLLGSASSFMMGNLSFIEAAYTLAYPFAIPPLRGLLHRATLELTSIWAGHDNHRIPAWTGKHDDPEVFNTDWGYHSRESDFTKRVGEIFDELRLDAEGAKLVKEVRKQGIVITRSGAKSLDHVYSEYYHASRTIIVSWNGNEMQSFSYQLIRELITAVAPNSAYANMAYNQAQPIFSASMAAFTALPLYLGWQLKESGRPQLWSEFTRNEDELGGAYSSTERFNLAVRSSQSPREALQDYIRDWCMGYAHAYIASRLEPTKKLLLPAFPHGLAGRIKWAALLPTRALYRYFKMAPSKAFNLVAGTTMARWPRKIARWTNSNYLQDANFNILDVVKNPPSFHDARDRGLKETAITDRDKFLDELVRLTVEEAEILGLFRQVQDSTHVVYASLGQPQVGILMDGQLDERNIPKHPTSLHELWKAVDSMASPLCERDKYGMINIPIIFQRSRIGDIRGYPGTFDPGLT